VPLVFYTRAIPIRELPTRLRDVFEIGIVEENLAY